MSREIRGPHLPSLFSGLLCLGGHTPRLAISTTLATVLALAIQFGPGSLDTSKVDHETSERVRLRAHFDSVLVELGSRDATGLSASQREARLQLASWLALYRDAGRFPLNDGYPPFSTPIFRDSRGVTCAMAYLIERSGRGDIVERIATTRNLEYMPDLAGDSSVAAWLDSAGLSVVEAARIQPAYERDEPNRFALAGITVVLSGASLATAHKNIFRPTEIMGFLGIIAGSVTVLGAVAMSQHHVGFTAINAVSGGTAILSGIYAAFRPRPLPPAGNERTSRSRALSWEPVANWVPTVRQMRIGIAARF